MKNEFFRVATFQLEDGDEYAIFFARDLDEQEQRQYLLVRPDGTITSGGRLSILKYLMDRVQDLVIGPEQELERKTPLVPVVYPLTPPAVASSVIDRVGWEEDGSKLFVQLHGGRVYTYEDVPVAEFWGLLYAPSPGYYWNRHIKNQYRLIQDVIMDDETTF